MRDDTSVLRRGGLECADCSRAICSGTGHDIESRGGVCFTLGGTRQVPVVVETLVFDRAQVTSKVNGNRPVWGGVAIQSPQETQGKQ